MKAQWTFIFILIFALVTAIFAVINVEPVQVHLLFTEATIPLILVILSSTLLGGLIVGLIGISKQFKLKRTIKQLEKQLNELKSGQVQPSAVTAAAIPAAPLAESENNENPPAG